MSNWIYCRLANLAGHWPLLRRAFDRLWFGGGPMTQPESCFKQWKEMEAERSHVG